MYHLLALFFAVSEALDEIFTWFSCCLAPPMQLFKFSFLEELVTWIQTIQKALTQQARTQEQRVNNKGASIKTRHQIS